MTHIYDASLYSEAKTLNTRAGKIDEAAPQSLIESLAFARDAEKRLDEEYADLTVEIKEQLKPFDADRKALKLVFTGAAKKFEDKLLAILKRDKKLPEETDNGVRLTVALLPRIGLRKDVAWSRSDAEFSIAVEGAIIPLEYLLPLDQCIDWKAVAMARGKDIELSWTQEFDQVSLRTKLPEV